MPKDFLSLGNDEVCEWLADGYHYNKTSGGKPRLVTASMRDAFKVSSSWKVHVTVYQYSSLNQYISATDRFLGNSVDVIGKSSAMLRWFAPKS
jgi:hypothetical protein